MLNPSTHCPISLKLTIGADPEDFRKASLQLNQFAQDNGIPDEQLYRLDLCLNEVLANILEHGGKSAFSESICLQFNVSRDSEYCEAVITVSDAGKQFDFMQVEQKPEPKHLDDAQPGGLGLLMLRRFTDKLKYCYEEGRNQLVLSFRWAETAK